MNDLPGYRIVRVLGTVYGLTVRARNWGADIAGGLKVKCTSEWTWLLLTVRSKVCHRRRKPLLYITHVHKSEWSGWKASGRVYGKRRQCNNSTKVWRGAAGQFCAGLRVWDSMCCWKDWRGSERWRRKVVSERLPSMQRKTSGKMSAWIQVFHLTLHREDGQSACRCQVHRCITSPWRTMLWSCWFYTTVRGPSAISQEGKQAQIICT